MQALARGGYTAEQVRAALHAPNQTMTFRYDLLDYQNKFKMPLTNVLSASVANNALASIKRTARFSLQDDGAINFLSDRIKPYARLWIPPGRILARHYAFLLPTMPLLYQTLQMAPESGGWVEWPLGVFILSTPPRRADSTGITRDVEAYDLLQVLTDDKAGDRYTVASGTNYIAAIKAVLDSAGLTAQNLVATDKTLPTARDWEPGTTKLSIIADLLSSINYRSLTINEDGAAVAEPYQSPDVRASEYTYANDSNSVIFPDVTQDLDLFGVANKWTLVVSEPDRTALVSTYTNSNPGSPTSTVSRGRTIVDYRTGEEAADQTTLDAKVQRLAFEASQVYEKVEFTTGIMPMHSDSDVYTLQYSNLGISAKYAETSWSFALKAGAEMKHSIRRVVTV